jgi:hypothetical protein
VKCEENVCKEDKSLIYIKQLWDNRMKRKRARRETLVNITVFVESDLSRFPTYPSFGGIGTHCHNHLLPNPYLISGPWSLWAPCFGLAAIDIHRLRSQSLALGDIYLALDIILREMIE